MKSNDKFGRSIRRGNMSILRYFIEKYFFEILAYILLSIGFFGIFKKMEIKNNWGAFIPFYYGRYSAEIFICTATWFRIFICKDY